MSLSVPNILLLRYDIGIIHLMVCNFVFIFDFLYNYDIIFFNFIIDVIKGDKRLKNKKWDEM